MRESIFTTFKVWDNGKMTRKQVLDIAFEHFMDIQETFGLHKDCSVREIGVIDDISSKNKVYNFEIMQPYSFGSH